MHNERTGIIVNWHMFDSLLTRDPANMAVVPHLAESFKAVNDLTWEFKLRKGVKFHNGEEFDANSVKFTFDRVLDEKTKSPQRGNVSAVKEVKIIDPYTVQLVTNAPYPLLPERMTYFKMLPPKYFQEVGPDKFATNAVGTGPYKLEQWVKGDRVILTAWENYWKGPAKIKKVIFRGIPEQATALNELAAGGIDLVREVAPDLAGQITKGGNVIATADILRVWHYGMDPQYPPFDDINFRKAIQHALNVDLYIKEIFQGKAVRVPALVNPKQFGFDPSVQAPKFDVALAKQYLAKSSYKGQKIMIEHYMKGAGPSLADAMVSDLKDVGITAEVKFYPETNALVTLNRSCKVPFNGGTWGSFSTFDADAVLQPFFSMGGTYGKCHQFNPEQNKLIEDARSTVDAAKRKEIYAKVQKLLVDEAWDISLFAPQDIYGMNKNLNYKPRADEVVYMYDASWK